MERHIDEGAIREWREKIERREAKVDREAQRQAELAEVELDREIVEKWVKKLVNKNRQ